MVADISFIIQTCDKVPDKNIIKTAAMTVTLPGIIQGIFRSSIVTEYLDRFLRYFVVI